MASAASDGTLPGHSRPAEMGRFRVVAETDMFFSSGTDVPPLCTSYQPRESSCGHVGDAR